MDLSGVSEELRESIKGLIIEDTETLEMDALRSDFESGKVSREDAIERMMHLIHDSIKEKDRLPYQSYFFRAREALGIPVSRQERRALLRKFDKMRDEARVQALKRKDPTLGKVMEDIRNSSKL